jgi:GAF domain-containing protein
MYAPVTDGLMRRSMVIITGGRGVSVSVTDGVETHAPAVLAYGQVVRAFQEVGEALVREVDRDRLLHLVLHKVCELVDCRRGSLYLLDQESGLFHGQVGVSGGTVVDARVKQYRCGVPADRLTHEILATRSPVVVVDAPRDPRPMRAITREWNIRSIVGVPMMVGDEVRGIMFLDDLDRPHEFSEGQQALASAFADMAAVAITTAQRAETLAQTMRTVARQNTLLRRAVAIEERLTALALRGGTIPDVTALLAELIGEPCAVHDARFRRITASAASGEAATGPQLFDEEVRDAPEVRAALEALPERDPKLIGPFPRAGLHRRTLVVPIRAREETWGYLLVVEANSPLRTMETLVASRAAAIIALSVTFQRSAAEKDTFAREALMRRLIDAGTPSTAIAARAEFHGLRSGRPYVAVRLASRRPDQRLDDIAIEDAAMHAGLPGVWLAGAPEGALSLIAELPEPTDDLVERFGALAARIHTSDALHVAISDITHSVDDLSAAHREAGEVLRILRTFAVHPGSPTILTASELGAARMLLAAACREDAERLVRRAVGSLAPGGSARDDDVLRTLQAFVSSSWGIRRAAAQLQVHENTVRYRLGRLAEATGRDVLTDPRAQLDAQLALLVLRLEGRLPGETSS